MTFFRRIFLNSCFWLSSIEVACAKRLFCILPLLLFWQGSLESQKVLKKCKKKKCNFSILKIGVGLPCFRKNFQKRILNSESPVDRIREIYPQISHLLSSSGFKISMKTEFLKKKTLKKKDKLWDLTKFYNLPNSLNCYIPYVPYSRFAKFS